MKSIVERENYPNSKARCCHLHNYRYTKSLYTQSNGRSIPKTSTHLGNQTAQREPNPSALKPHSAILRAYTNIICSGLSYRWLCSPQSGSTRLNADHIKCIDTFQPYLVTDRSLWLTDGCKTDNYCYLSLCLCALGVVCRRDCDWGRFCFIYTILIGELFRRDCNWGLFCFIYTILNGELFRRDCDWGQFCFIYTILIWVLFRRDCDWGQFCFIYTILIWVLFRRDCK